MAGSGEPGGRSHLLKKKREDTKKIMRRRRFLEITLAATIALTVSIARHLGVGRPEANAITIPGLLSILRDPQRIHDLGHTYRASHPEENDPDKLIGLIAMDASVSQGGLMTKLDKKVREDFKDRNTVLLQGWILSRTEARQCALFSLLYA